MGRRDLGLRRRASAGELLGEALHIMESPLSMILEFARAEQAGDPFAFRFAAQEYLLRLEGGVFKTAWLQWDQALLSRIEAVRCPRRDPALLQELGQLLRDFLAPTEWATQEVRIAERIQRGQRVLLTIRSAAAELYALPWELLTFAATGQHLGELPGVLLRYEWPAQEAPAGALSSLSPPSSEPPLPGGRILLAWSAAGGVVPAAEHQRAIWSACQAAAHPFNPRRDVLEHASCSRLSATLAAAEKSGEPFHVLHLLCHGGASGSTFGLMLNGESTDEPVVVDAGRLRQLLAPYALTLRLVVLAACDSGNSGVPGNQLGSVAQALHRAGIAAVVASRYPLSVAGSMLLAETLYEGLLTQLRSLEASLLAVRHALAQDATQLDWASLQFYARKGQDNETRPFIFRPFRGLLAFQLEHQRFFVGRDREIQEICDRVHALWQSGKPRLLVSAGASGTGKSSLLLAGAVPQLLTRVGESALLLRMRPGATPLEALSAALAQGEQRADPILLVIDQFEELFTHVADPMTRSAFGRRIWQLAAEPGGRVTLLVALRVDFIGRCGELVLSEQGLRMDQLTYDDAHRVFVGQLSQAQLRAAIALPAQRAGLRLEDGLVTRILAELGDDPGALPLLQDLLDQLWQRRSGRTLTLRSYDALGGVAGALSSRADALLAGLKADEQRIARRLFVQLFSVAEDLAHSTRRRVRCSQLRPASEPDAARFDRVLSLLCEARLVVCEGYGDAATVEVAHEALIRSWPQLLAWVRADRQMLIELSRLEAWAKLWLDYGTLLTPSQRGYAEHLCSAYPQEVSVTALQLLAESRRHDGRRQSLHRRVLALVVLFAAVNGLLILGPAITQRLHGHGVEYYLVVILSGLFTLAAMLVTALQLLRRRPL